MKIMDTATDANVMQLFDNLVADCGNWGGQPLFGEGGTYIPVLGYREDRALLTHLKRRGLVTTIREGKALFVWFTDAGKALAAERTGREFFWY